MPRVLIQCLLAVSVCLIPVPYSWAVPVFTISGSGNVYSVQGDGLEGVGGVDLAVHYDPSTLVNPRAVLNGLFAGTLMQAKTSSAGIARVLLLANRPGISGAGGVITLTFDRVSGTQGCISLLSAQAVTSRGEPLQPQTINLTGECPPPPEPHSPGPTIVPPPPPVPVTQAPAGWSEVPAGQVAGTGKPQGGTGGISATVLLDPGKAFPAQDSERGRNREVPPDVEAATVSGSGQGVAEPAQERSAWGDLPADKPEKPEHQAAPKLISVLNLFKEFKGIRSKDRLVSLFSGARCPGVRQEPEIVISDGKNKVKVALTSMPSGWAPSYIISGGELVSYSLEKDTNVFEIRPKQNALEVSVTVVVENDLIVIPVTAAPPLDTGLLLGGRLNEKSYGLFLQEMNKKKADINGDGVRDYVDDYICTAHYLVGNLSERSDHKRRLSAGK